MNKHKKGIKVITTINKLKKGNENSIAMDTWNTPTLIETQDYNIVMKINIEFMGKSLETLEYIPKSLNVEPETVLKYGVEILHDIILAHGTKHILKRFKDGNYVIVGNIFSIGLEFYNQFLKKYSLNMVYPRSPA